MSSLLDTDLYKLTMQQVVHRHFPNAHVAYRFTNRRPTDRFSRASFDAFEHGVRALASLRLTSPERAWLSQTCPYLTPAYLDFLAALALNPAEQVEATFHPDPDDAGEGEEKGSIEIVVRGKWAETILYEVPLMALLSEAYFKHTDTDWSLEGVKETAKRKGLTLLNANIFFSEFGTRRRRSAAVHDLVLEGLLEARDEVTAARAGAEGEGKGKLVGTSNVERAMRYGLTPVGTVAHELFMGVGALDGYKDANDRVLDLWEQVYPPHPTSTLHIALTDTFTTASFFSTLTPTRARAWRGVRHDSGEPVDFARRARETYDRLGVDPRDKTVVFSDGLNVERCLTIKAACDELDLGASFGIGTFLTNDFARASDPSERSQALNIVIKLAEIDGHECVKLSDEPTKNSGSEIEVARVRHELGLEPTADRRSGA